MAYVALGFCLLICCFGGLGLVSPPQAVATARRFATRGGMIFAGVLRLAMGVAFLLAAPVSRTPDVVSVLGLIVIVAGVATFFFSPERFERILAWWESQGPVLVRVQGTLAITVGLLLAWVVRPVASG